MLADVDVAIANIVILITYFIGKNYITNIMSYMVSIKYNSVAKS